MLEKDFQRKLIKEIHKIFPGSLVIKNDSSYIQGIPDLTILWKNKWAMLECKKQINSSKRPNQEYYINMLDEMSFAKFINPKNMKEVLNDLQRTFRS